MALHMFYFSPTGTTRRVVEAIAAGVGDPATHIRDCTLDRSASPSVLSVGDLMIVGLPVYGGRIPVQAESALRALQGNGAACIVAAVYGNRAYEDALLETADLLEAGGFRIIAAGTFIGEHSFDRRLANNRPDQDDLAAAASFGRRAGDKWRAGRWDRPALPGNRPYKERKPGAVWAPEPGENCAGCGRCTSVCPMQIISPADFSARDPAACIHCCACAKSCPAGARLIRSAAFEKTRDWLLNNFAEPRRPEYFL